MNPRLQELLADLAQHPDSSAGDIAGRVGRGARAVYAQLAAAACQGHCQRWKPPGRGPWLWQIPLARPPQPAGPAARYAWRGTTRAGVQHQGVMTLALGELAPMVAGRFARRWRELTFTRDGVDVAGICPDPGHPARRTWWAETTTGNDEREQ